MGGQFPRNWTPLHRWHSQLKAAPGQWPWAPTWKPNQGNDHGASSQKGSKQRAAMSCSCCSLVFGNETSHSIAILTPSASCWLSMIIAIFWQWYFQFWCKHVFFSKPTILVGDMPCCQSKLPHVPILFFLVAWLFSSLWFECFHLQMHKCI